MLDETQSAGDIPVETTFTIINDTTTATDVTGLFFDSSTVRSAHIEYSLYRYHLTPFAEVAAVGTLRLIYKDIAGTWAFDDTRAGDATAVGVTFSVLPSGQVQYTSTDLGVGTITSEMKFRARVTEK